MTSSKQPTAPETLAAEQAELEATANAADKPAVPAFSFPFNPSAFAQAKKTTSPGIKSRARAVMTKPRARHPMAPVKPWANVNF